MNMLALETTFISECRKRLGRLDAADRASAYVKANCCRWPDAISDLKPDGWERTPERDNTEEFEQVWKVLHEMTSAFDRSQAWWVEKLGRTKEQHLGWWLSSDAYRA